MILKKTVAVLLAALGFSAVIAGSAQAMYAVTTTTEPPGWNNPAAAVVTGPPILGGTLGGGVHFNVTATEIEGVETVAVENGTQAQLTGKLKLTEVSVSEPVGCKSASSIETVPLTGTFQMGDTEATSGGLYVKFAPTSGEVLMTIKLEGEKCTVAGSYQLKGTFYAKVANSTGTFAVWQGLSFSKAINSSQGGALLVGKEAATLEGGIKIGLTGGEEFKIVE